MLTPQTTHAKSLHRLLFGIALTLVILLTNRVQATDLAEDTISQPTEPRTTTTINVQSTVQVANARKLGINIGSHDRFGASQLLKNVIINPGFEAGEYGQIFHTSADATGTRIQQENWRISYNAFTSLPADFWNGANYEITYGPAKGRSGTITDFTHEDDKYTYYLDSSGTAPNLYDVVLVTTTKDNTFYPGLTTNFESLDSAESHSGQQSIRLDAPDVVWRASHEYYMDTLYQTDSTAEQMIVFDGEWCLNYWAKAENNGEKLNTFMWRVNGNGHFMFNTMYQPLADTWHEYSFQFTIDPNNNNRTGSDLNFIPPIDPADLLAVEGTPAVTLGFRPEVGNGYIWIDDVELYPCDDTNPTAFSDTYVDLLKELQPGTIRDWGSAQLGATLDNQLAIPFERKTTWHNPRLDSTPKDWHYSLHEFLELAQEVEADPWYVVPPTFSDQEMENLAEYLAAPATSAYPYAQLRQALGQTQPWTAVFDTIHLEYGNEMWGSNDGGDPFLGATAKGGTRLGQLADLRFEAFDLGLPSGINNINRIIGGQINHTFTEREIEDNSDAHDSIALSPYFAYNIDYATNDEELYYPIYARIFQDIASGEVFDEVQDHIDAVGNGTELAVYEISFHTTSASTTSIADRNNFVTGLNGGLALPLYMLTYQKELGIRPQTAFVSSQYSFKTVDNDYLRLWGMLRDVEATARKRPTWLGMEIANKAVKGDMLRTVQSGAPIFNQAAMGEIDSSIIFDLVQSFAFQDSDSASVMVFNLDLTNSQDIQLNIDIPTGAEATRYVLTSANIDDDNESAENVTITTTSINDFSSTYNFTMPPNAIYVYTWSNVPTSVTYLPLVTSASLARQQAPLVMLSSVALSAWTYLVSKKD